MDAEFIISNFTDGILEPNYVNGRLLTGEDLRQEQESDRARLGFIGRAAGYGIIKGLVVSKTNSTTLSVTCGLGINRAGQAVRLGKENLALPLVQQEPNDVIFHVCQETGVYLLIAKPTFQLSGEAVPVRSFSRGSMVENCGPKWVQDGVEFRVIKLNITLNGAVETLGRNQAAHWAYGSEVLKPLASNPFVEVPAYGLDKADDVNGLTWDDLPLALFYWNNDKLDMGIEFVDNWSVRRRLVQPYPSQAWGSLISDKRAAEGQARFLQFQEQLAAIDGKSSAQAADYFRFLPPFAYIPLALSDSLLSGITSYASNLLLQSIQQYIAELPLIGSIRFITPQVPAIVGIDNEIHHVRVKHFRDFIHNLVVRLNYLERKINNKAVLLGIPVLRETEMVYSIPAGTSEVTHIFDTVINSYVPQINTALTAITAKINTISIEETDLSFTPVNVVVEDDNPDADDHHVRDSEFNSKITDPFNAALAVIATPITVRLKELTASAIDPVYDSLKQAIDEQIDAATTGFFSFNENGFVLENFLADYQPPDSLPAVTIQPARLGFVDRSTAHGMLNASWQSDAIDLQDAPQLDVLLAFEDSALYTLAALANLLNQGLLVLEGDVQSVIYDAWAASIEKKFKALLKQDPQLILERFQAEVSHPPLYAMLTSAIHLPDWVEWSLPQEQG